LPIEAFATGLGAPFARILIPDWPGWGHSENPAQVVLFNSQDVGLQQMIFSFHRVNALHSAMDHRISQFEENTCIS